MLKKVITAELKASEIIEDEDKLKKLENKKSEKKEQPKEENKELSDDSEAKPNTTD